MINCDWLWLKQNFSYPITDGEMGGGLFLLMLNYVYYKCSNLFASYVGKCLFFMCQFGAFNVHWCVTWGHEKRSRMVYCFNIQVKRKHIGVLINGIPMSVVVTLLFSLFVTTLWNIGLWFKVYNEVKKFDVSGCNFKLLCRHCDRKYRRNYLI